MFEYVKHKPTEDGWYLVKADDDLCVAEFYQIGDTWSQVGAAFDVWTY